MSDEDKNFDGSLEMMTSHASQELIEHSTMNSPKEFESDVLTRGGVLGSIYREVPPPGCIEYSPRKFYPAKKKNIWLHIWYFKLRWLIIGQLT